MLADGTRSLQTLETVSRGLKNGSAKWFLDFPLGSALPFYSVLYELALPMELILLSSVSQGDKHGGTMLCVYLCMCTLLSFKLFDEFHLSLAESGGLKTHSVKRTDLVEGRNLVYTSREATSASLPRHHKSHLHIIVSVQLHSFLVNCLKKYPFLHTPGFLQVLASH